MPEEEFNEEIDQDEDTEQYCFDILISSLADGVIHDEELEMDHNARAFIIDEVLNCLEDHLDEEGFDMMNAAFEKYEKEYSLAVKTEDIINSLEWNVKLDEEYEQNKRKDEDDGDDGK